MRKKKVKQQTAHSTQSLFKPAPFLKRVLAWMIDSCIILPVVALVGFVLAGLGKLILLTGWVNEAESFVFTEWLAHQPWFLCGLAMAFCGYFVWFWCRDRQTPGMSKAGILIVTKEGEPISSGQALVRLATSACGLSNLMVLFDKEKQGFQDYWANTQIIDEKAGD